MPPLRSLPEAGRGVSVGWEAVIRSSPSRARGVLCGLARLSEGGCNLLEPLFEPGFAEAVEDMVDRVRVGVKASQDACGIG